MPGPVLVVCSGALAAEVDVSVQMMTVAGSAITPYLTAPAQLRIEVLREYPYLYDGDLTYERRYLAKYSKSARSTFVLALHNEQVIGCATGLPLQEADAEFRDAAGLSQAATDAGSGSHRGWCITPGRILARTPRSSSRWCFD